MNWGQKITIGFIGFVVFIIGMVTISMRTDFFLVEENYYEEELAFQDKIESRTNGTGWQKNVSIANEEEFIDINFEDAENVQSGKVYFFRPSNAELDFSFPLTENLKLPKKEILPGKWIVNFEWQYEGKKYVKEETIYVGS
ncbi:FixH family protein [Marivirga atlantica]|jgi:nitrogen fixation protein FixH|uniref:FixH family protein n=1 Tax=Marivirga atlantica TaxID=1548457 RepID=A0A937ANQ8_9BACT|nr:FixH family protein [Marivirga atlantica]MBL0766047.1 FixH family protein [Marivirga atlantica]